MHVSVHACTMNQELCSNLSTSDMPSHKVELSFTSSLLLWKATILIVYLLSSSHYNTCHVEASMHTVHCQIHTLLLNYKHLMLVQQMQWATPLLGPFFKFALAVAGLGQK